jgi:DNA segregation ATPase FtsK/SpoIIIE-like protein
MLLDLVNGPNGVHARYDSFKALGNEHNRIVRNIADASKVTGTKPHISVVVLDEINVLLESAKRNDKVSEALKVLLQMGAGAGVFVLGGAQYLSAQVFSRDGSKQFTSRALFGAYDRAAVGMMFGSVDTSLRDYVTGIPGRGLIRTVNQQHTVAFQALHCSENDILDAIAVVSADGSKSYHTATAATSALETAKSSTSMELVAIPEHGINLPQTAPEPAIPEAVDVPELERVQIVALARAGISRGKICEQIYGARGGRGYTSVKRILDAAGL